MLLTIPEALKKSISAQKEGKLQEAEQGYRSILQLDPIHADANHNLGVLALSVGDSGAALPYFETALASNPQVDQFWVSFIKALITDNQPHEALANIKKCKKLGIYSKNLEALENRCSVMGVPKMFNPNNPRASFSQNHKTRSKVKKNKTRKNTNTSSPPQVDLDNLLKAFQKQNITVAEKLALTLTQEFPQHPFGWKVLGEIFKVTGRLSDSLEANQESVLLAPDEAEAHNNLGVALQNLDRHVEAESVFRKSIALLPSYPQPYLNLGNTLIDLKRPKQALEVLEQVIKIKPDFAEAHNNLGIALIKLKKPVDAINSYREAVKINPGYADAHNNLANELVKSDKLEEGEIFYRKAIAANPMFVEAYISLGTTLQLLDKLEEAETVFRKIIELKPNSVEAYAKLGATLKALNKLDVSEKYLRHALTLGPHNIEAHFDLGALLQSTKRLEEAEICYKKALELKPDYAEALTNLGTTLHKLNRLEEAVLVFKASITIKPNYAETYNNLGVSLCDLEHLDEAAANYHHALSINPEYVAAFHNLGILFEKHKKNSQADSNYKKAIALDPNFVDGKWSLSLFRLKLGAFTEGWKLYENRYHRDLTTKVSQPPVTEAPQYLGENFIQDLAGRHLFICPEQGVGDEVMFASILPELASLVREDSNTRITLACEPRLVELFKRSFDFISVVPSDPSNNYQLLSSDIDNWIFSGSLPKVFRHSLEDFNKHQPYLLADKSLTDIWKTRFDGLKHKLNVGISWTGGSNAKKKEDRSLSLQTMLPILKKIDQMANIINLQYGDRKKEIEDLYETSGIQVMDWEHCDPLKDLENFSAQIAALDLIVSIDNSTVHFGGALGTETFVMLPFNQDWRWMEDSNRSHWYPNNVTLFRQTNIGDWAGVIKRVADTIDLSIF
jgi:tetratricopeptide (TPR) repeat protein